jgi:hypothetical protein
LLDKQKSTVIWPPEGAALLSPCQPVGLQDKMCFISERTPFKMIHTRCSLCIHLAMPDQIDCSVP